MSTLTAPIRIKRGVGTPSTLKQGELAFDENGQRLFIGSGVGSGGNAATVVELTTPPALLEQLQDVVFSSGPNDGDVLTYDGDAGEWIAQAVAAASVAWGDVTSKPSTFAPATHASSHHTGGADAIAASDIGAIANSEKGANSGVATLDGSGKLTAAQLPNLAITAFLGNAADQTAMLALTGQQGDWAIRTDSGAVWIITGETPSELASWTQLSYPAAPVASVNGETGTVVLDHTDVGAAASSHTHAASDITSGLATVATTGAYSDLSGTPDLGTAAYLDTTDFVESQAASTFGLSLLNDADAAAARTTLGLGSAATLASTAFADVDHSHEWSDITSGVPSTFAPSAHNHGVTVTLELSGFIEAPEAKTYVLSPSIPAAITIVNVKAQTGSGTCDIKLQDDGSDISNTTLDDVGSGSVATPGTEPSAAVAAGSKLALVVSDPSSSAPEDLAFTVYYTVAVTSANNA